MAPKQSQECQDERKQIQIHSSRNGLIAIAQCTRQPQRAVSSSFTGHAGKPPGDKPHLPAFSPASPPGGGRARSRQIKLKIALRVDTRHPPTGPAPPRCAPTHTRARCLPPPRRGNTRPPPQGARQPRAARRTWTGYM